MTDKFQRHDSVTCLKSGEVYMVVLGPVDGACLATTGEPAYMYQLFFEHNDRRLWVRSAAEMEGGQFAFKHRSTHGASGRTPDT